jgi:hypothetical protein
MVQHHQHTNIEGWDNCYIEEWWRHGSYQEKNARRWPEGHLFPRRCGRSLVVEREIGCAQEKSLEEEDFGWSPYVEVLH